MNNYTTTTTKDLVKQARTFYITLPNDQAEVVCAPLIAEINKRIEAIGAKYGANVARKIRLSKIKTIHDLIKFRN